MKYALPPAGIVTEDCVAIVSGFLFTIVAFKFLDAELVRPTDSVPVFVENNEIISGSIWLDRG